MVSITQNLGDNAASPALPPLTEKHPCSKRCLQKGMLPEREATWPPNAMGGPRSAPGLVVQMQGTLHKWGALKIRCYDQFLPDLAS